MSKRMGVKNLQKSWKPRNITSGVRVASSKDSVMVKIRGVFLTGKISVFKNKGAFFGQNYRGNFKI